MQRRFTIVTSGRDCGVANRRKTIRMQRDELARYLDSLLEPQRFKDYCPNGLQVEGRDEVRVLVTGVTASLALLDAAIALGADAILVHHGWFWRGEDGRVTGTRRARLARLLGADMNLFGYHLPLDAHPELGNNAQLAARLGLVAQRRGGEQDLVIAGIPGPDYPGATTTAGELAARVAASLGREPMLIGDPGRRITRLAWCSGGAQDMFESAIAMGAQAYITGEVSEPQVHLARETGTAYLACGHHATERYGVQAVGNHLAAKLGLQHHFVDLDNPV